MKIERALCNLGPSVSLMPYSMFHKLHSGPSQPASFSLQLADGSETRPLGTLEDVLVKKGEFWLLEDFIITDMIETDDAQIILGRPLLATSGCSIDVNRGRITFKVGSVMYVLFYGQENCFPQFFPI